MKALTIRWEISGRKLAYKEMKNIFKKLVHRRRDAQWGIVMEEMKNKKRHMILGLLFLGWCLSYLDRMAMNVGIVEIAKDFNLSPSVMGIVLSSFFAGYAIMQLPGGWLADKFGSRKVITISILLWSAFYHFNRDGLVSYVHDYHPIYVWSRGRRIPRGEL